MYPKFKVVIAIILSVILIGGSFGLRFFTHNKKDKDSALIAVGVKSNSVNSNSDTTIGEGGVTPTPTSLTDTDIIGRKLILDYVDLATAGQANEKNIDALANQYVEGIQNLNQPPTITSLELHLVSNTKANFSKYDSEMNNILNDYHSSVKAMNAEWKNKNTLNKDLYSFAKNVGIIYENTVKRMREINVPYALASPQVKLINNYISNASSMKALSETNRDSSSAFSGLITLNDNPDKEAAIIKEINQILLDNGL